MTSRLPTRLGLLLILELHALAFASGEPRVPVLIVDGFSNHDWRLMTSLIRGILEPTGLFDVSVSTAPPAKDSPGWDAWRPRFADYDVVIRTFNDIWGGPSWPRAVQQDFEDFVRGEIPTPTTPAIATPTTPAIATPPAPDPSFHIFLCLGQSNMEGFPGIPEEDKAFADPRFQVLAAVDFPALGRSQGNWYAATPPLCRPNSGLSPADYFGRTLIEHLPADNRVGVVNVSVAGARIEVYDESQREAYLATAPDWMRGIAAAYGGSPYRRLVAMAKRAQRDGVIRGILLHQGEANTNDPDWPVKVRTIYENLLRDLGLRAQDVPLLAGELVGADQNGASASMNATIARLPDAIPTAHVVSSEGCAARDDRLHFKPEGYRELGRRFAHTMLPLLEQPQSPTK